MDMQLAKMELIEMLLHTKKESVLKKIKAILEEEQDQLTEQDYQIIEARRNKHLVGESKSYSWEEVRKKLGS
ncbi:hypothetical protein GOQ30_16360 [Flavobacterium sp. TP390]|uniref:Addiction module protein n=1 Tax=Flavobacterium profundi TaxID=1774945 RepID=A0A6I4IV39_9FLAO|nr:hypothetical protein [Flavobacterium profundi]MVO10746.1 hypothetical protein [Flavobacterium profundi]